jgi:hypothetical protein
MLRDQRRGLVIRQTSLAAEDSSAVAWVRGSSGVADWRHRWRASAQNSSASMTFGFRLRAVATPSTRASGREAIESVAWGEAPFSGAPPQDRRQTVARTPVACVPTGVCAPWPHRSGRAEFKEETKCIHAANVHPFAGCGEMRDRDPAWRTQSRASRRAMFVQACRPEEKGSKKRDGTRVAHVRPSTANLARIALVQCNAGMKCVPHDFKQLAAISWAGSSWGVQ